MASAATLFVAESEAPASLRAIILAQLHPATARLAALETWNADTGVAALFAELHALSMIGNRLAQLQADRPDLGAYNILAGVGQMSARFERSFAMADGVTYEWHVSASSGVCGAIWSLLAEQRGRWIEAVVASEGLNSDDGFERGMELAADAPSVEAAFKDWTSRALGE